MKALSMMNNVEKVNLLVTLFPQSKIVICEAILKVNEEIELNHKTLKSSWNIPLISFDYWRKLSNECTKVVLKYDVGKGLKTPSIFSDQLADGMLALFTIHCISEVATKILNNEKFNYIQKGLFNLS